MKTKTAASLQTPDFDKVKKSLFDDLITSEMNELNKFYCNAQAQRVAILLNITYNRGLSAIRESFKTKLSQLCQEVANAIDNELSKTETD